MEELNEVYYPLSKITHRNRDVALLELQNAQSLSNNQTKIYSQFANILIASSTLIISIFLNKERFNVNGVFERNNLFLFSVFLVFTGILVLRYFVDLQKEITINARKVVILRAMLGLNYNSIQLTLPNDRIEGATNPFKVKFFNGWFKFQTIPFWLILILVLFVWSLNFYSFDTGNFLTNKYYVIDKIDPTWLLGYLTIILIYYFTFRISLLDKNETLYLHIGVTISKLFKIKLFKNFESSIYRAKLSYVELDRLRVDFRTIHSILIRVEDKEYFKHSGINYKALLRGLLSQFQYFRNKKSILRSGGSTLNMQLARTIFIPTNQNPYKRKVLELFIGKWLNQVFSKEDLIKVYIASVRFGYNIMGLSEAIQKYFEVDKIEDFKLSKSEAFFLVERLSSITDKVNYERINHLLKLCGDLGIDQIEVFEIYKQFEKNKKFKDYNVQLKHEHVS